MTGRRFSVGGKGSRQRLVWFYVRLARSEEREVAGQFGDAWTAYAARVPGFVPHVRRPPAGPSAATPPSPSTPQRNRVPR